MTSTEWPPRAAEPLPLFPAALCRERPDLPWFGGGAQARITEAIALCCRCPELAECHSWADDHAESGIWGGLTQTQRDKMRDSRGERGSRPVVNRGP